MNAMLVWLRRQLADPQVVALTLIVLLLALSIWMFGQMLAPLLASLVIAYLLDSIASQLRGRGVSHMLAVLLVFTLFLAVLWACFFWLLPLLESWPTRPSTPNSTTVGDTNRMVLVTRVEIGSG